MENVENNLNVDENNGNQTDPMAPKLFHFPESVSYLSILKSSEYVFPIFRIK